MHGKSNRTACGKCARSGDRGGHAYSTVPVVESPNDTDKMSYENDGRNYFGLTIELRARRSLPVSTLAQPWFVFMRYRTLSDL